VDRGVATSQRLPHSPDGARDQYETPRPHSFIRLLAALRYPRGVTFIDWSDAEGMIELFTDFVRDEWSNSSTDTERRDFLDDLLGEAESMQNLTPLETLQRLREIYDAIRREFRADPASLHLADLIQELERTS
jgi:hypothetical protein